MNTTLQISKFLPVIFCVLAATIAYAEQEGDFTYSIEDKAVTITKYTGAGGAVTIPEKIAGVTVKEVGMSAFSKNLTLTEITIPSSVNSVGARAFYGCTNLTKVSFKHGVAFIGPYAFQACTKLTAVTFPSTIENFENMGFGSCTNLVSATFEGNAPTLANGNAFYDAAPGFEIRYYKGSTGFTTPEWNGYKTVEIAEKPKHK